MTGEREFTEIFVEGAIGLTVDNGTARLVFGRKDARETCERLNPPERLLSMSDDPLVHPTHCLVMPMSGLMQLVAVIQVFLDDDRTQRILGAAHRIAEDAEASEREQARPTPSEKAKTPAAAD